jgi:hypothetical protein
LSLIAIDGLTHQVRDPYYPDDIAHEHAARVLDYVLKSAPAPNKVRSAKNLDLNLNLNSLPPTMTGTALPREEDGSARPLQLYGKLFFSHVHKVAGTTLNAYLTGLEGINDCAATGIDATDASSPVVNEDHVSPTSWAAFERWWFHPEPRCNFASIEDPELGEVRSPLMATDGLSWPLMAAVGR